VADHYAVGVIVVRTLENVFQPVLGVVGAVLTEANGVTGHCLGGDGEAPDQAET
jgi:phosphohistidine swiveling domain-containing protein